MNRLRRLRQTPALRRVFQETRLHPADLIYPIFVSESAIEKQPIESMPGQYRHTLQTLEQLIEDIQRAGVNSVLLFGLPKVKDNEGTGSRNENGIVQRAIRLFKQKAPEIVVMTDVCLCAYVPHGHCGVLDGE